MVYFQRYGLCFLKGIFPSDLSYRGFLQWQRNRVIEVAQNTGRCAPLVIFAHFDVESISLVIVIFLCLCLPVSTQILGIDGLMSVF